MRRHPLLEIANPRHSYKGYYRSLRRTVGADFTPARFRRRARSSIAFVLPSNGASVDLIPPRRETVCLGSEDNPKKRPETAHREFTENHTEKQGQDLAM